MILGKLGIPNLHNESQHLEAYTSDECTVRQMTDKERAKYGAPSKVKKKQNLKYGQICERGVKKMPAKRTTKPDTLATLIEQDLKAIKETIVRLKEEIKESQVIQNYLENLLKRKEAK